MTSRELMNIGCCAFATSYVIHHYGLYAGLAALAAMWVLTPNP